MTKKDMTPVDQERLDVAENAVQRLLSGFKAKERQGRALRRLRAMEAALAAIHAVRLVK